MNPAPPVSWREAVGVFVRVGLQSFGGPAGQIAVMHRVLVEEKRWLSESRFLHALHYCMLLPGPEAMQLITYVGWLLHRWRGGLMAGALFVLPGFLSILALSILYGEFGNVALVAAFFFGIQPAVLGVVVEALLRIGRRALRGRLHLALALASFLAIFLFGVPFPLIVIAAALTGSMTRPRMAMDEGSGEEALVDRALAAGGLAHTRPTLAGTLRTAAIWLVIWLLPVAALGLIVGAEDLFFRLAIFFSKAAVVTFGGAYAVLAYVAQEVVHQLSWLRPGEMLDGLGMAETTPGPLIQVVQFVGFLAAHRHATGLSPLVAGIVASVIVTWVTFAPCFLWIFLGAPYLEGLRSNRRLAGALSGVTAAVVGVILNLAVWFALHTLFREVRVVHDYGLTVSLPRLGSVELPSLALALLSLVALLRWRLGMVPVLLGSALLGMAYRLLT